ncbi:MAG: RNA polymerase sigma factor [Planctomycetes bacterium]|nr:RNA polymerase sigma factor [Planctomycetota bacterium]
MGAATETAMSGTQRQSGEAPASATRDAELEALLAQVAARDRAAFERLYRHMETHVYNLALQITGNRADAEEAVQDALLKVWIKAPDYLTGNAASWILRIVARASLRKLRTRGKHERLDRMAAEARPLVAPPVGETKDSDGCLASLREHLGALDDEHRSVVALYYGASMSQCEIAELLETTQQTISYRLKESLDLLRRRLRKAGSASTAAALPLLPGPCALLDDCYGQGPAPESMAAKVFEHIARGAETAGRESARAAAAHKAGWGLWAVLAALCAGAGAWYVWPKQEAQSVSAPAKAEAAPAAEAPERPPEWYWNFGSGPAVEGLRLLDGAWRWQDGIQGEAGMVVDGGCTVLLPIEPRPGEIYDVEIAWYFNSPKEPMSGACGWFDEKGHSVPRLTWNRHISFPVREKGWHRQRYIFDVDADTVVSTLNDKLFIVGEFDPHPQAKILGLRFEVMYVHSVRVRRITQEEIPEALRDREALKKELGGKSIYRTPPKD